MIPSGTMLAGRYRVVRHLGSGAMASVELAEDTVLRRQVAVKRVEAPPDSEFGRRVRREARLGARLGHPNLVTIYDTIADDRVVLLVMEYVPGGTLARLIARGPLEPSRALAILSPLAAALDHVHAAGVIHRDVKPANVLLSDRGEVKLSDLGVATSDEVTQITETGQLIGTAAYMAPEQFDPGPVSPAVDVYALAAVAYEMLSGRPPYSGATVYEVMRRVRAGTPPDLCEVVADAPREAADALRRGLALAPDDRPFSAGTLVAELEVALRRSPTAVQPVAAAPAPDPTAEMPARVEDRQPEAAPPEPAAAPPEARAAPAPSARPRAASPARPPASARRRRLALPLAAGGALLAAAVAVVLIASADRDPQPERRGAGTTTQAPASTRGRTTGRAVASDPSTPVGAVRSFYERAADGDLDAAYELAGPRFRRQFGSRAGFERTLGSLESITFRQAEVISEDANGATVRIRTIARHTDRTDRCSGTLRAERAAGDGGFVVEPAGVRCTSG